MKSLLRSLCFLAVAVTAAAQTDRGTLTGVVTDPTGAVVPNAVIQAKNSETGAAFEGGTSATGNYTISVPRGTYELDVTITGFKKYVRQNLEISVASTTR